MENAFIPNGFFVSSISLDLCSEDCKTIRFVAQSVGAGSYAEVSLPEGAFAIEADDLKQIHRLVRWLCDAMDGFEAHAPGVENPARAGIPTHERSALND